MEWRHRNTSNQWLYFPKLQIKSTWSSILHALSTYSNAGFWAFRDYESTLPSPSRNYGRRFIMICKGNAKSLTKAFKSNMFIL